MLSQYYKKTPSSTTETIWNWLTGTEIQNELRTRKYGVNSTQSTDSSPKNPSNSSNSIVNNSKERNSSLFGNTESIHRSVTSKSSQEISMVAANTKSTRPLSSVSIKKHRESVGTQKSKEFVLESVSTSSTRSTSPPSHKRTTRSKSSSLHTLTRISSQKKQSHKWCTGTNLCIFFTILGCCAISAGVIFGPQFYSKWYNGKKKGHVPSSESNAFFDDNCYIDVYFVHSDGSSIIFENYEPNSGKEFIEINFPDDAQGKGLVYYLTMKVLDEKEYYAIGEKGDVQCRIPTDALTFKEKTTALGPENKATIDFSAHCPEFKAIQKIELTKESKT